MDERSVDGRLCPICLGPGRESLSYPAALCRGCEEHLVDWAGRPVRLANTSLLGTGIEVSNGETLVVDEDTPIFADGIACWAREARFGGVVVQPVGEWLRSAYPSQEPDRKKTLSDFGYDGRAILDYLLKASPWGSIDQTVASLSVFAHPDIVAASGQRAIFRTIRRAVDRGKICDGVMCDDNYSPAMAFEWSTGFKRRGGSDLTCCHLYAASEDPESYTDLRNLFYAPSFISKLTDNQASLLPSRHALNVLRYRAFALYGYCGPRSSSRPNKPEHYGELEWAEPFGARTSAYELEDRLRAVLAGKPKDRITKSAARCGWAFSGYEPDLNVVYSGH